MRKCYFSFSRLKTFYVFRFIRKKHNYKIAITLVFMIDNEKNQRIEKQTLKYRKTNLKDRKTNPKDRKTNPKDRKTNPKGHKNTTVKPGKGPAEVFIKQYDNGGVYENGKM